MKGKNLVREPVSQVSQMYVPDEDRCDPYALICLKCPTPDKPCKKGICSHFKREYYKLKIAEEEKVREVTPQ